MEFVLPGTPKHVAWINEHTLWFIMVDGKIFEYEVDVRNPDPEARRSEARLVFSPTWFPSFPLSHPSPYSLIFAPTGARCLSFGRHLFVFNPTTNDWLYSSLRGSPSISRMAFSPNGQYLALGDARGTISIKTANFSQELAVYAKRHTWGISARGTPETQQVLTGEKRSEDLCCALAETGEEGVPSPRSQCSGSTSLLPT